jgi:hypothetical protein
MKFYTVVPNEYAPKDLTALFSTLEKALDFVKINKCMYRVTIFESEVRGDYQYPNEVYLVKRYAPDVLDAKVFEVKIYSKFPILLDVQNSTFSPVEPYVPDLNEHIFLHDNSVIKREDITKAIEKTMTRIRMIHEVINNCIDMKEQRNLLQELKTLQYEQLRHIGTYVRYENDRVNNE